MGFDTRAWLEKHYGPDFREGTGRGEVVVPCPECGQDFYVNTDKGVGICFRAKCGFAAGSLVYLYAAVEGVSRYDAAMALRPVDPEPSKFYKDVLAKLAHEDDPLPEDEEDSDDGPLKEIELPDGFVRWTDAKYKPAYFAQRGLTAEDCETYGIGFTYQGRYRERLVVPVVFGGKVVNFVARLMRAPEPGDRKVLDADDAPKRRILFNYDRARTQRVGVLTEGVFDSIRVGTSGMALCGTTLSLHHVELLRAAGFRDIVVLLDADAHAKALALVSKLQDADLPARPVLLPKGDPDDYSRAHLWRLIGRRASLRSRVRSLMP